MNWFYLVIISVFAFSIFFLLRRSVMKEKDSDAYSYAVVFQFMGTFIVGLYAFLGGFGWPKFDGLVINYALMAVLYAITAIFIMKAAQLMEASELTIIASTTTFWTIIAALIFLEESFSLVKIIGTILIIFAVVLVSLKKGKINLNKGVLYALAFAFVNGIAFVNDLYILRQAKAVSYATMSFFLPGIVILLYKPKIIFKVIELVPKRGLMLKILLLALLNAIGALSIYLAYQSGGNASQLSPIAQSSVILTVILAAVFLGERDNLPKKIIGAVLVTIGVILLR